MRHLILGTAGHIDHGKSALVKALTGVDPDRLKEEKRRGITIELGFADMDLGDGRVASFVDVPGHERFVRHMVAGATGIDAVLLVVAADQGVQPQTREHLHICTLLGVSRGVVALTKADLVDDELREVVTLELRELLEGTFVEDAPLVVVSARSGEGIDALRQALATLFDAVSPRPTGGVVRLSVDRSFVLRGFGTVVTGTLGGGVLREGDEIEVLPGGRRGRIRGLQVHGRKVGEAVAGQRTAANLQGLECADAPRGATLTHPARLTVTRRALGRVRLLPSAGERLKSGGLVRFHHGTSDGAARMRTLLRLEDGSLAAELRLEEQAVLAPGDRFILRRPAPVDTVGGGVIVDVRPGRPQEADASWFDASALAPETAAALRIRRASAAGRDPRSLAAELGLASEQLEQAIGRLAGGAVRAAGRWFDGEWWARTGRRVVETVTRFHVEQPLARGVSREKLRAEICPEIPQEAWRELLSGCGREGGLRLDGELVALDDHRVELSGSELDLATRIRERLEQAGLEPPGLEEIVEPDELERARQIAELLVARGELVRIQDRRLFHAAALDRLRERLRDHARTSRRIGVPEFKRLAGVTRKNAIPLLEQLDAERTTRRIGDEREILI